MSTIRPWAMYIGNGAMILCSPPPQSMVWQNEKGSSTHNVPTSRESPRKVSSHRRSLPDPSSAAMNDSKVPLYNSMMEACSTRAGSNDNFQNSCESCCGTMIGGMIPRRKQKLRGEMAGKSFPDAWIISAKTSRKAAIFALDSFGGAVPLP